jgi:hypothetical protein
MENTLIIRYLLNRASGERVQYVGFSYTKINSIYGYLGIDNDEVIFIYADENGVVKDVMADYEIIQEKVEQISQPVIVKSVCENCGCKIEEHSIASKLCPNKFSHFK